jgi:hypothetical protein
METICSSQTLVDFYWTIQHDEPEYPTLQSHYNYNVRINYKNIMGANTVQDTDVYDQNNMQVLTVVNTEIIT